ncbi:MAG: hypothetical protein ACRD2I_00135 [Vicinamibacterales bacterium]
MPAVRLKPDTPELPGIEAAGAELAGVEAVGAEGAGTEAADNEEGAALIAVPVVSGFSRTSSLFAGVGGPYVLNQPSMNAPAAKAASREIGTAPLKRRLLI